MARDRYMRQVELLVRTLPYIARQDVFALKGGTAINLFYRDIVATGTDCKDADEVFVKAPWIAKPWYTDDFVAEVAKALNQTTFQKC